MQAANRMKLLKFLCVDVCSPSYLERVAASAPSALPPDAPFFVAFAGCRVVALFRVWVLMHLSIAVVPEHQQLLFYVPTLRLIGTLKLAQVGVDSSWMLARKSVADTEQVLRMRVPATSGGYPSS